MLLFPCAAPKFHYLKLDHAFITYEVLLDPSPPPKSSPGSLIALTLHPSQDTRHVLNSFDLAAVDRKGSVPGISAGNSEVEIHQGTWTDEVQLFNFTDTEAQSGYVACPKSPNDTMAEARTGPWDFWLSAWVTSTTSGYYA